MNEIMDWAWVREVWQAKGFYVDGHRFLSLSCQWADVKQNYYFSLLIIFIVITLTLLLIIIGSYFVLIIRSNKYYSYIDYLTILRQILFRYLVY